MPKQMNTDTGIHNSEKFFQIHFLSFELQIQEHKCLINTNGAVARKNKLFPCVRLKNRDA